MMAVLTMLLLVGAVVFLRYTPEATVVDWSHDPHVEMAGSVITGYARGQMTWQIEASLLRAREDELHRHIAHGLTHGTLYDVDQAPILTHIQSDDAWANVRSGQLIASSNVQATWLSPLQHDATKNYHITADQLSYSPTRHVTTLSGHVVIANQAWTITTTKATIDHQIRDVRIDHLFRIVGHVFTISGRHLTMDIGRQVLHITGGLSAKRLPTHTHHHDDRARLIQATPTQFLAQALTIHSFRDHHQFHLLGNVVIRQSGNVLTGGRAFYTTKTGFFSIEDDVILVANHLKWLLNQQTLDHLSNPHVIAFLDQPTTLNANMLTVDPDQQRATILSLQLVQPTCLVVAQHLVYDDAKKMVDLRGDITYIQPLRGTVRARSISIDLNQERFHIVGLARGLFNR